MSLLKIKNLCIGFNLGNGFHQALYGVSLELKKKNILSLVGESGSGKSLTAMSILRLLPQNAKIISGEILFESKDLLQLINNQMQQIRGKDIALIPQDPMCSLNPLYTIGDQLLEVINLHQNLYGSDANAAAIAALEKVKIPNAKQRMNSYPHELSGGMKQRVIVAMALATNAKVIIADEPTTALDVTVQAEIMNLLNEIKENFSTSIILITHNLGLVAEYADDVAVKYVGASTLQRALLHAACIRYNYDVVQWGMQQLKTQNIQVDNQYLALSFVGIYSRPARRLLSEEVVKRVERLGKLETDNRVASNTVQQSALSLNEDSVEAQQLCPALQFSQWLRQGFAIYTQQKLLETSVELEIHLDKKKHKLPYFDGSYKILLDDKEIGTGNFIKGYTLRRKTSPGKHKLTAYAPSGIISTPFEFEVEQDNSYHIEMDYKLHAKDGIYDVFASSIHKT